MSAKPAKPVIKVGSPIKVTAYCVKCRKKTGFTISGYRKPTSARGGVQVVGKCDSGHDTVTLISRNDASKYGMTGATGGCPCAYGGAKPSAPELDVTEEEVVMDAPDRSTHAPTSRQHQGSARARSRSHSRSRSRSRSGGKHTVKSRSRSHSRSRSRSRSGGKHTVKSRSRSRSRSDSMQHRTKQRSRSRK